MKSSPLVYPIPDSLWIEKLCRWADMNFDFFALTNGNGHQYPEEPFATRFFAGNQPLSESELWSEPTDFKKVGIIGYDFKNRLEKLKSENADFFELPEICFFRPSFSLTFNGNTILSEVELTGDFWEELEKIKLPNTPTTACPVTSQTSKEVYLENVKKIQNHIVEGDTYESNFCQAYTGTFDVWDPIGAYFKLNRFSPMPFSALFKAKFQWLVSASPERYLKRVGTKIITQPIKGTIKRGKTALEDAVNKKTLANSEKEQAENLMITDLMRNDLSKVSQVGSVEVNELFGIYPLPRIFQMISTVSSVLAENMELSKIIQATFPMGSMTGAP